MQRFGHEKDLGGEHAFETSLDQRDLEGVHFCC